MKAYLDSHWNEGDALCIQEYITFLLDIAHLQDATFDAKGDWNTVKELGNPFLTRIVHTIGISRGIRVIHWQELEGDGKRDLTCVREGIDVDLYGLDDATLEVIDGHPPQFRSMGLPATLETYALREFEKRFLSDTGLRDFARKSRRKKAKL